MDKMTERKKMVLAMEYIARQVNDENKFMRWLYGGVADGDIEYGDFDIDNVDESYIEEETFSDLMTCFLRTMVGAWNSGGLWCGRVVSKEKEDFSN